MSLSLCEFELQPTKGRWNAPSHPCEPAAGCVEGRVSCSFAIPKSSVSCLGKIADKNSYKTGQLSGSTVVGTGDTVVGTGNTVVGHPFAGTTEQSNPTIRRTFIPN